MTLTPTNENQFPPGWDEQRVRRVLEHYEGQSEGEAVTEDEAAFEKGPACLVDSEEDRSRQPPGEAKN